MITGVNVPVIDVTVTLPKTRKDGSPLSASDIESVTVLRNSTEWQTVAAPFSGPIRLTDSSPATGADTYSFYATDTAGARSEVSPVATVSVSAEPPKAPPAAGTVTAVIHGAAKEEAPKVEPEVTPQRSTPWVEPPPFPPAK